MAFYVSKTPKPTLKNISKEQKALLDKFKEYAQQELKYVNILLTMMYLFLFIIWFAIFFWGVYSDTIDLLRDLFAGYSSCILCIIIIHIIVIYFIKKSILEDYATHKMAMRTEELQELLKELEDN